MKKEVKRIEYRDAEGNAQEAMVGISNVISIWEHKAQGEGDKWHYDINFEGGDTFRVFDVVFVALIPKQ